VPVEHHKEKLLGQHKVCLGEVEASMEAIASKRRCSSSKKCWGRVAGQTGAALLLKGLLACAAVK